MFAANVKCPGTEEERTWRVEDLIEELELQTCENLLFGSEVVGK